MSKSKKIPRKSEICKDTIDKVIKHRTFNPSKNSQTGNRIVRLQIPGESIIGFLGWPITNLRESTSYPIQLESGEIVEVLGNRLLHKQIRDGDLCGQKIEIVYQGRDYAHGLGGHYRKVYRIYKYEDKPIPKKTWNKILADAKIGIILFLAIFSTSCRTWKPDGFSAGVLTTKIPGQGPVESKQVYGLILSLHWNFEKGVTMSPENNPKATFCPNCQQPAIRDGKDVICENCDAIFTVNRKSGNAHVKDVGRLEKVEQDIEEIKAQIPGLAPEPQVDDSPDPPEPENTEQEDDDKDIWG